MIMELKILSPEHQKTFTVTWVELTTPSGAFTIMLGHAPMVLTLKPNSPATFCFDEKKQETIMVPGGIAEISRTGVMLLLTKEA